MHPPAPTATHVLSNDIAVAAAVAVFTDKSVSACSFLISGVETKRPGIILAFFVTWSAIKHLFFGPITNCEISKLRPK